MQLQKSETTGHDEPVAATFRMGWDMASPFEQKVLSAMSLLAPAPIPRRLLRKILGKNSGGGLSDPLDKALSRLSAKLSMVELDEDADPRMHRLISDFVRAVTAVDNPLHTDVFAAVLIEMRRANDEKDTASFRELEKVLPHVDVVLASDRIEPWQAVAIANYTGRHHWKLGRFRLGEQYLRKALELVKSDYSPGALDIARQQSNLALVLRELGEFEEARDLLLDALDAYQKKYDAGHPSVAGSQSNLAAVLKDLGQLVEARDFLRDALEAALNIFSPGHPSIANRQLILAAVLQDLGQLEEARDLLREALDTFKKKLEAGHPDIALAQSNLALVLRELGEFEEARDLLRDALEANQKIFQPGHPSIAIRQTNLGMVLADLGEFDEAAELLTLAYHAFLENVGPDHPNTKIVKGNLKGVIREWGGKETGEC